MAICIDLAKVQEPDLVVWPEHGLKIDEALIAKLRNLQNGAVTIDYHDDVNPHNATIDPVLLQIALLTPILGVSDSCYNDSLRYIEGLNKAEGWALMSKSQRKFQISIKYLVMLTNHWIFLAQAVTSNGRPCLGNLE